MANSMVRHTGNPLQDFPRQSSNEIFQRSHPELEIQFIKEETTLKPLCTRMDWKGQKGIQMVKRDNERKIEGSPVRSLSPEFLLKSSEDALNCGVDEMEGEMDRKDDGNSVNSTNDVITPVTCIYCNKVFPSKSSVDVHVLAMHDGKKVYDCSVCDKQFIHRSSRNIHLRVHTDQRPYECEICKKRFRVSSHLRDHVRTHTGERPFKCVLCGRGFKQSSDMKKHRKTHYKTSSIGDKSKTMPFNKDELSQESQFMNSRAEHLPGNYDNNPLNNERLTQNEEQQKRADETTTHIKVENKSSCDASPLSCDSGVKVESDNSASPENITGEKMSRYSERLESAVVDVTTARMPVRYHGYGNIGNGLTFQEQGPAASYYKPVFRNNYQVQTSGGNIPEDNFHENRIYAGMYPINAQYFAENLPRQPVPMQNGEFASKQDFEKRSRTTSDEGRPTMVRSEQETFYQMENSDVPPVSTPLVNAGKGPENVTPEQGKTSEGINPQNGVPTINVETVLTSESMDFGNPSEENVDGLGDSSGTGNSEVVRKAVQVKVRSERKGMAQKRITGVPPAKKLPKKGRDQGPMQCASCHERFRTLEVFTAHACEKNDKSFKCSVCSKMFARSTLLRQHMVLHQGTKRFKFKCNYCGRAFRHRSHLRDHERIHTGERPFKCSFCPKAFKQSSDLRKHENLHTGATRYCCEKCGLDFKRCDALKKHAMLHPHGEVTVLKCEKCQSLFATSDGHSSHVCHSKDRYRCQLCVQRFSSAPALRKHCHEEHGDQSNTTCLKCEFCNLELQSLDELEVHLGTHQLLKTHQCNSCDQRFSLISQLEEHVKSHGKNAEGASKNLSVPVQPMQTNDLPGGNEPEDLYVEKEVNTAHAQIPQARENEQTLSEPQAVTQQSFPVLSSNESALRKPGQKYNFIASRYQSLVHSTPIYEFVKNIVKNGRRCSPLDNKKSRALIIPSLVESPAIAQQDREFSRTRNELPEHNVRPIPSTDDVQRTPTISDERALSAEQTTEAHDRQIDEHFSTSLRQTPKRMYDCLNCGKSFSEEHAVASHVCFIQTETFFHCLVCEKEFRYYEDLVEHMRMHWKHVVYIRCSVCGEKVKNEDKLKEHNLKHIEHNRTRYSTEGPEYEKTSERVVTSGEPVARLIPGSVMSSTISSFSTPVITSVSGDSGLYSKAGYHDQAMAYPHGRSFQEKYSSEIRKKVPSPITSPRSANEPADNGKRSLGKFHPANEEEVPRSRDPDVSYFEARKRAPGTYLNVICQGSTMVVPAMHTSGGYPGGMVYPITTTEVRMSEQKQYEN